MLDAKKNKGRLLPYLRNPNVQWFDVDTSELQTMPFEDHELERYGLRAGDVVICEGGDAGRAAIWDGHIPDLKFQKAIHRVRTGPDLYNRYFVHRLMADQKSGRLSDYLTGTTIRHFTGQDLARYTFPLPPLDEQRRIAAVLDRAEALRAKRRAALAQLDTLTQAIFLDMFGDPGTNPRDWEVHPISDYVASFEGGRSLEAEVGEGVVTRNRVLKVSAVTGMKYNPLESKPIPDSYQPSQEHFVRAGDLLFSRANTSDLVGAVAYVEQTPPDILLPDKIWRFVWREPRLVDPLFVWALFQTPKMRYEIGRRATGTSGSMKNISQEKLLGIRTIVPNIREQREFSRRFLSAHQLSHKYEESALSMERLFASLQHRAFCGEI
jgi:type I restriction enzyme S subunit